jgi:hypothetical protein
LGKRLFGTNNAVTTVAAKSLESICTPALPILLNGFTNRYTGIQTYGPFEYVDLKPYAKSILPSFRRDLTNSQPYFRWRAAQLLGNLRLEPKNDVLNLTKLLKDEDCSVRFSAVCGLGKFGVFAIPAMPAISNVLSDSDILVRLQATNSLRYITESVTSIATQVYTY